MRRRLIPLPLFAVVLAGCVPTTPAAPPPATPAPARSAADTDLFGSDDIVAPELIAEGTFQPSGAAAVTYDPALVPPGATVRLSSFPVADGLALRLSVTGMVPGHMYGAHLHTRPCTAAPDGAGPHYQHEADPKASASAPSVDPSYANPDNEVWLDFTADRKGRSTVTGVHDRQFDAATPPRSLVVHAERTRTGAGVAGSAGARVACLTVDP
jgi:superoxide dismutase, Cu-Zn family